MGGDALRVVSNWSMKLFPARQGLFPFFYLALALLIMGPLLSKGFILTLDMVFGPVAPSPTDLLLGFKAPVLGAKLVPQLLIGGAGAIIPMWLVQKSILLAIFAIAGVGAHRLPFLRFEAARYFAGILYVINPFVYARFMAGQWYILVAYAFAPFAIKSFVSLMERPKLSSAVATLLFTSVVAINAHLLAMTLVVFAFIFVAWLAVHRRVERGHAYLLLLVPAFFLLNAYWLVPAFTANDSVLQAINEKDLDAFAASNIIISPWVSVATMHGFWRVGYDYAVTLFPAITTVFSVFIFLVVYGLLSTYRHYMSMTMAGLAVVALVLGAGVSGPFEALYRSLTDNVPLFDGFRDSQKFVFFLVLAYAYLGALGIEALLENWKERTRMLRYMTLAAVGVGLLAPGAFTFTMLWGFNGDLKTTEFPKDWHAARDIVNADSPDVGILVLPWDSYTDYDWVPNKDQAVRTLARAFFDQPLVYPKNVIRRSGIFGQSFSPEQAYVKSLLDEAFVNSDFGSKLPLLGARYVLLSKDSREASFYRFLFIQNDLELVMDTPTLALFKNGSEVHRAYLSETPDASGPLREAAVTRLSMYRYEVEAKEAGSPYIVFVPPNNDVDGWRLEGLEGIESEPGYFGVFPLNEGGILRYEPFYTNLVWYSVSLAFLALIAAAGLILLTIKLRSTRMPWQGS